MPAHSSIRHLFANRRVRDFHGALYGALTICTASLAPAQEPSAKHVSAPDAAPLLAADRALAARAADGIAALAASSAPEVVFLYPGAAVEHGREAVRRSLDSIAAMTHDRLVWSPARIEISSDGLRGYAYGRGTRTTVIDGRDSSSGIRYVAWWRRDESGTWRPAAWLLIDERADGTRIDDGLDRTTNAAAWPCRTPTTPRFAPRTRPRTPSRVPSHASPGASRAVDVIAVDSAFAARSAAVGAAIAFAEYVADDGISLGASGAPACGKHAVGAQLDGVAPSALEWSPIIGDASGDLGYTVGTATIRGERSAHYSKYLTVWKREPDGAWRFVVDGGNAAPARVATFTAQR